MVIKTKGLVLKQRPVGERDLFVTILTDSLGVVDAAARGAKSLKSKLQVGVQVLCFSDFTLFQGKSGYVVNAAEPIEQFYSLRLEVEKVALAGYFCELVRYVALSPDAANEALRLLLNTLFLLSTKKRSDRFAKMVFEFKLMCLSGFSPRLDGCAECGESEPESGVFLIADGLLLCADCARGQALPYKAEFNAGMLKTLRYIADAPLGKAFAFQIDDRLLAYLSGVTEYYLLYHCGHTFKTLDFYKNLAKQEGNGEGMDKENEQPHT